MAASRRTRPVPRPEQKAFGRRVRGLRETRQWSQATLAERSGLDTSYVSEIERGLRDPSLTSLRALAGSFDLSLGRFLTDAPPPSSAREAAALAIASELEAMPESALQDVVEAVRILRKLAAAGRVGE